MVVLKLFTIFLMYAYMCVVVCETTPELVLRARDERACVGKYTSVRVRVYRRDLK